MKKKVFYQLEVNDSTRTADINIYGMITSAAEIYEKWGISEGEVSAHGLKQVIDSLDVDVINVYINSYGGEVSEALAIYTALRRHKATVNTFCDGFACSAATIIFCAGEERTMGRLALMMIHNCMSYIGYANSEELRKAAEDNDKINQSSIEAYKRVTAGRLSEEQIKEMMSEETWMSAEECLEYGFATAIADGEDDGEDDNDDVVQSAFASIRGAILQARGDTPAVPAAVTAALEDIREQLQMIRKAQEAAEPGQEGSGDPEHPQAANKAKRFFGILAGN